MTGSNGSLTGKATLINKKGETTSVHFNTFHASIKNSIYRDFTGSIFVSFIE